MTVLCPTKIWCSPPSLRKLGNYFALKNGPGKLLNLPARTVAPHQEYILDWLVG